MFECPSLQHWCPSFLFSSCDVGVGVFVLCVVRSMVTGSKGELSFLALAVSDMTTVLIHSVE